MIEETLGVKVERRFVVALTGNPDKPFRRYVCDGAADRNVVTALCVAWWDRVNHKLLEWKGESVEEEAA